MRARPSRLDQWARTASVTGCRVSSPSGLVAVSVAVWAVLTLLTVAANEVLIAPAATVTLAGTATAESLLESATVNPPVGAVPYRLTRHESVPAPEYDCLLHVTPLRDGTPSAVILIVAAPCAELLAIVTMPVYELV